MTRDRILTTHVGSLIRPAELTAFLLKQQNGEAIDTAAYEECLRTSVADVVRKQAEIGIDIISDGEFGKNISWSRYVLERLSGFTERQGGGVGSIRATAGKDRRDFAEFYAEYEAAYGFVGMGRSFARTGLVGGHRPDQLYRAGRNQTRHRGFQDRACRPQGRRRVSAGRCAGQRRT